MTWADTPLRHLPLYLTLIACNPQRDSTPAKGASPPTATVVVPASALHDASDLPAPAVTPSTGWSNSKSDTEKLRQLLTELSRKDYPIGIKPMVDIVPEGVREIENGGQRVVAAPFRVHFPGYAGGHCRFAVVQQPAFTGTIIPLSIEADYPHCERMQKYREVDLNHDGVADFIFRLSVPSNKYPTNVSVGAVYVSNPREHTYCHAEGASDIVTLEPEGFPDPTKLATIIASLLSSGSKDLLDCTKRTP